MRRRDLGVLACPRCTGRLRFTEASPSPARRHDGDTGLVAGSLTCRACSATWPVRDGLPELFDEDAVGAVDRLMRFVYDWGAPLHDAAVDYLLPALQCASSQALRDAYLPYLELAKLRSQRRTTRILEVGIGTGANLPLLERDLPPGLPAEIWGCDLSAGMLAQCRRRRAAAGVRLLLADAHALPFASGAFDRVFHVGGISGYHDPARALAEMARVARPRTPIVVVDEQLDPQRRHGLHHRLAYLALTFYNPGVGCPRAALPPDSRDVLEVQLTRFYYCLRFRARRRPPTAVKARTQAGSVPATPVQRLRR